MESPIKLGLMPPLTGVVGIYGEEITRAAQIACAEINAAGGVLGRPLDLVVADDGSLPESAVAAALRLTDEHGCAAIVGNLLSNSRIAVAYRVAEPRGIPYLNFSFNEGGILSRYFFNFAALPNQQIDRMIPHMREHFGPRMYFAGSDYEWPRGSIDAARRALERAGGSNLGESYLPLGAGPQAFEALLDRVARLAPDVFVPYFAGADQIALLAEFTARGLKERIAVVMGHFDEVMASRLPPAVRAGLYSSNTYFMSVGTPQNRRLLDQLVHRPGVTGLWPQGNGILTNFGEGVWLCVKAFAQAAERAGSLDAEALIDALGHVALDAPQGAVRMDAATHHAAVNGYLARCRPDGGFDIVEAFGLTAPSLPGRYYHLQFHTAAVENNRLFVKHAPAAIAMFDAGMNYLAVSDRWLRDYGRGHADLVGRNHDEIHSDMPEEWKRVHRRGLAGETVRNDGELWTQADGSEHWLRWVVHPWTHPDGSIGGIIISAEDITERKRAEIALRRHADELDRFNRLAVGRELRMIELKREINALRAELGRPSRYGLDGAKEGQ